MQRDAHMYRLVEVLVGDGPYMPHTFAGRLLAKEQVTQPDTLRTVVYDIYVILDI